MPTSFTAVNWIAHDTNGQLLRLYDVKLETVRAEGVYIIYQPTNVTGRWTASPRTIYVGQGVVADRLATHRRNLTIASYDQKETVMVAFAPVNVLIRDGVERFLSDRLRPLLGDAHPTASPVPVNLPASVAA